MRIYDKLYATNKVENNNRNNLLEKWFLVKLIQKKKENMSRPNIKKYNKEFRIYPQIIKHAHTPHKKRPGQFLKKFYHSRNR